MLIRYAAAATVVASGVSLMAMTVLDRLMPVAEAQGSLGGPPHLVEVTARLAVIDRTGRVLTLTAPSGGKVQVRVDGDTTIFVRGRTGSLDDLAVGMTVRATYEPRHGLPVADWLEISG